MASLDILRSDPINSSNEITENLKLGESMKKYFVVHHKFLQIFKAHQDQPKIFHGPYKSLLNPLLHT